MTLTVDLATTRGRGPTLLCRDMIKSGTNPEQLVEFVRGKTPVFAAKAVQWWAERRVREADVKGPMRFERIAG